MAFVGGAIGGQGTDSAWEVEVGEALCGRRQMVGVVRKLRSPPVVRATLGNATGGKSSGGTGSGAKSSSSSSSSSSSASSSPSSAPRDLTELTRLFGDMLTREVNQALVEVVPSDPADARDAQNSTGSSTAGSPPRPSATSVASSSATPPSASTTASPSPGTTRVAVLLGKKLIRDQVTVEYAKRIFMLMKQITTRETRPSVVCFTGGKQGGLISSAAAGYTFFRKICEQLDIDVSDIRVLLLEASGMDPRTSEEMLRQVQRKLGGMEGKGTRGEETRVGRRRRRMNASSLSSSSSRSSSSTAASRAFSLSRCRFTFISSDYELFHLQEIQRLTSSRSVLRPLLGVKSTWDFVYAFYPFCVSSDAVAAFLGRVYVVVSDLRTTLANLEVVVSDRMFFAKENWDRLNASVAKLRHFNEMLHRSRGEFPQDMRVYSETLESCLHSLREAQQLLLPLMEAKISASSEDVQQAKLLVSSSIDSIQTVIDPDQTMTVEDIDSFRSDLRVHLKAQMSSETSSVSSSGAAPSSSTANSGSSSSSAAASPSSPAATARTATASTKTKTPGTRRKTTTMRRTSSASKKPSSASSSSSSSSSASRTLKPKRTNVNSKENGENRSDRIE